MPTTTSGWASATPVNTGRTSAAGPCTSTTSESARRVTRYGARRCSSRATRSRRTGARSGSGAPSLGRDRRWTTTTRAGSLRSIPNAAARAASGACSSASRGASASSSSAPFTASSWARTTSPTRESAESRGAAVSAAGLISFVMNPGLRLVSTSQRAGRSTWAATGAATACQPATRSSSRPGGCRAISCHSAPAGGSPVVASISPSSVKITTWLSRNRARRSTTARSGSVSRIASTR